MVPYKAEEPTLPPEQGPYVIGVTGASGVAIAARVLDGLAAAGAERALVVSASGAAVLREELGETLATFRRRASRAYRDDDFSAPIASGSRPTRGMVVVPCSTTSLAKIAVGIGDTLITRAAHVHLKERRPLVLVPRETPLSAIELRHMARLAELGAVILMASPAFYLRPKSLGDVVDYLAGKVLDQLGVPHGLYRGWKASAR